MKKCDSKKVVSGNPHVSFEQKSMSIYKFILIKFSQQRSWNLIYMYLARATGTKICRSNIIPYNCQS